MQGLRRWAWLGPRAILAATGISLLAGLPVAAQDPTRSVFTTWGAREGLSASHVRAIAQDADGVLWIGTQGGLNRFDGRDFDVFRSDPELPEGLSDNYILAIGVAENGQLWIGSYQGGLDLFDPKTERARHFPLTEFGTWTADAPSQGPDRRGRSVRSLAVLGDGSVLALTDVGLAHVNASESRTRLLALPGLPPDAVAALATCPDGGALVGGRGGEAHRVTSSGEWVATLPRLESDVVSLACGAETMAGTADRLVFQLDTPANRWLQVGDLSGAETLRIRQLLPIAGEWLVGTTQGLFRIDPETGMTRPFRVGAAGGLPSGETSALLEDRRGSLWIGTWTGLARRHPLMPRIRRVLSEEDFGGRPVIGLEEMADGSLLIGLHMAGVRVISDRVGAQRISKPNLFSPLDTARVYDFARGGDQTVWIASFLAGVWRWDGSGSLDRIPLVDAGGDEPRTITRSVLVDRRGEVWAVTEPLGLMRFDPAREVFSPHLSFELGSTFVSALAEDDRDNLWVAAYGGGLALVGPDRTLERLYTVDSSGLASDRILSIFVDQQQRLWLGTEGDGLIGFDPGSEEFTTLTVADGLPSDLVQAVRQDESGDLWISTGAGVVRYDPTSGGMLALRAAAGLAGDQFYANGALVTGDGWIHFGGEQGLTSIDPVAVREFEQSLSPPSLALTGFSIQGRDTTLARALSEGHLRLAHDENFFAFRFTADDYADPSLNRYEYRLTPLQQSWVDAGSEPVAAYTSVPPGEYTFEVAAANSFGMWNRAAFSLPVTIVPAFWQTTWFQGLIVVTVLSLVAAFFTYRYRQLEARTKLRLELAGRLHDDIGADLSSISLKTELVRSNATLGDKTDRLLEDAGRLARDTAQKVRETVWMVNTQYDTLSGLITKMRDTADTMLVGHIPHDFRAPERIPERPISMEFRQNAHLLYKEALNNARKYSDAPRIRVDVEVRGRELTFRVVDEGLGFDPKAVESGNGQRLMRERARAAGGHVSIESAPGKGTTVEFTGRIH